MPLLVEVFNRGSAQPALETQFLQAGPWTPDASVLTPQRGQGTGFTATTPADFAGVLKNLDDEVLPGSLAGFARQPSPVPQIGVYGSGLTTFAVLTFRRGTGGQLLEDALDAGATRLTYPDGTGAVASAPLVNLAPRAPVPFARHVPACRAGQQERARAGGRCAGRQTGSGPGPLITTQNLTKRFGNVEAVREVSLDVREGDRYGLLGPNGSGKSTLVRMLLGLVYATSGEISVLGHRVPKHVGRVLPEIGALIEEPAAYPHLSGRANLRLLDAAGPRGARRTRRRRVDDALEQVGLAGIDRRPVRAYSLGMRQRLGLAAALVRRPRLLILDEPTNGLDPRGIRDIRDLLVGLNADGVTVFLSSHLLPEVSALCTRIGVLDSGRLVLQDQLASLQKPTGRVLVSTDDPERAVATLDGLVEHRDGADLVVRSPDPAELNARLVGAGVPVRSLVVQRRSLEEIVLDVTGAGSDQFGARAAEPGGTVKVSPPPSADGAPPDQEDAVLPAPEDAAPAVREDPEIS